MSGSTEELIGWSKLARLVARHALLIAAFTMISTGTAALAAWRLTEEYRAKAVLTATFDDLSQATQSAGALSGFASLIGFGATSAAILREEALAILKSDQLAADFVSDRNLLPKLFPKKWDGENQRWRLEEDRVPTLSQGIRYFDRNIRKVIDDRKTGLITLQLQWRDRHEAAEWAADLVRRVNRTMRDRAIETSEKRLAYLQEQLQTMRLVPVTQTLYALIETQIKTISIAKTRDDYALKVLDPPRVPDADDSVWPNKPLFLLLGTMMGMGAGLLAASLIERRQSG